MPVTRLPDTSISITEPPITEPPIFPGIPDQKSSPPLLPVRHRGFPVPKKQFKCPCQEYWRRRPRPGTGALYSYMDHQRDCQQHRFSGVFVELQRYRLVSGPLWVYAIIPESEYEAWGKRINYPGSPDYNPRFGEELVKVVKAPEDQRIILTPFPPLLSIWDTEPEPVSHDALVKIASRAVSTWRYPQKAHLVETRGIVSWRDFLRLENSASSRSYGGVLSLITTRWLRMAEIDAHRLEESLGSLGLGLKTYQEWHERTCPICTPGYICGAADENLAFERRRREFRRQIVAAWKTTLQNLVSIGGLDRDTFDAEMAELRRITGLRLDSEARRRREELGLVAIPALAEVALPKDTHEQVLDLAQSPDRVDQMVAMYISDLGAGLLSEPFARYKDAKVVFSQDVQQVLGDLEVEKLLAYTLARECLRTGERMLVDEVKRVLEMYRTKSRAKVEAWYRWQMEGADPPLPLVIQERRAA